MTVLRRIAASVLLASVLTGCTRLPPPASGSVPRAKASSVLLISLDGFRADYLDRGLTPRLSRVVREGVRAEWMTPTYPSLTFPNHYTVVTGLHPDHHGIVHNMMRDAKLGAFSLGNREAVGNGAWWGGEPIWYAPSAPVCRPRPTSGQAARRQFRACVQRAGNCTTTP